MPSSAKSWEIGWLIILGILFAYEMYAVFLHHPDRPTLTRLTVSYVPAEVTLSFLAWLWLHFAIRYFGRA